VKYKKNWSQALARQEAFWNRRMGDRVLARIFVPNEPFQRWLSGKGMLLPSESAAPPDERDVLELWERKLSILTEIEDDSLPVMIPTEFDEGLFGGIFGARTRYAFDRASGWFSSMAEPYLEERTGIERLRIPDSHPLLEELERRLRFYAEASAGMFAIGPVISIDTLNFAVQARGATHAYLDLFDDPGWLGDLFDFSLDLALRIHALQRRIIGRFQGGSFDGYAAFGGWFAGDEIQLSVDAFGLCGKEVFRELGLSRIQRLIDRVGSGFLHVHSNASHLLPDLAGLRGLAGIWLVDEEPRPFPRLERIKEVTRSVPLVTECMLDEFTSSMERGTLPTGVFYIIRSHKGGRSTLQSPALDTVDEANRLMERIRSYQRPTASAAGIRAEA
jgi:hypothetical protein